VSVKNLNLPPSSAAILCSVFLRPQVVASGHGRHPLPARRPLHRLQAAGGAGQSADRAHCRERPRVQSHDLRFAGVVMATVRPVRLVDPEQVSRVRDRHERALLHCARLARE